MLGILNDSETGISKMALAHLGVSSSMDNVLTERSVEAEACRLFYDQVIRECHRDYPHSFSTSYVTLGLVEENPNSEWAYSYRYPSECLFFRRILSGSRNDSRNTRVPVRFGSDNIGKLIYTDKYQAIALITRLVDDPVMYPPDFLQMASLLLANYIAPKLSQGDAVTLGKRAMDLYRIMRSEAINMSAEEEQEDLEPPSEFMKARI